MRITFKSTGGIAYFPGLSAPRVVEVSTLPADRQQEIQKLVDESRFFELPSRTPPKRGSADYQTYTITVDDGGREHSVQISDPVPPHLERLVDLLRELTESH